MSTDTIASVAADYQITLIEHEDEPRIRDIVLGKKLGMARPRDIRKLIERHMDTLTRFGTCATVARVSKGARGAATATEYLLNEEQAVYLVTQSDAPNALETKVAVVKVFVAWRHGHLVPDDERAERQFGIVRMLAHKVTEQGKIIDQLVGLVREQAQRINDMMLLADTTGAVTRDRVSVRQLLDEAKAMPRKRRSLQARVHNALTAAALDKGVTVKRCIHSGVWLFPVEFAKAWMAGTGADWVKAHNDALTGQGVLKLVPRETP